MRTDPTTRAARLAARTHARAFCLVLGPSCRSIAIDPRDGSPLDHDPEFNLGSVAKTFTTAVLAHLVLKDEVDLDAPIRDVVDEPWLPDVTFGDLAAHTSGLPREAPKHRGSRPIIASTDELRSAVDGIRLAGRGRYHYSNLGFLVLGYVIEHVASQSLPTLVQQTILSPLGMERTHYDSEITNPPIGVRADNGEPVEDRTTLPGPGGYYSTADDLHRWVRAHVEPPDDFAEVVDLVTRPRVTLGPFTAVPASWNTPAWRGSRKIGLDWRIEGDGVSWHTGGTNGFTTFCAFNRGTGTTITALLAAGIGALPDSPTAIPAVLNALRLRQPLMQLARTS